MLEGLPKPGPRGIANRIVVVSGTHLLSTSPVSARNRKFLNLLSPFAFFLLCLGLPFEVDYCADTGCYCRRNQEVHHRVVVV